MGLALPEEFLPEEPAAAGREPPASAPGRLVLRVEGAEDAAPFLAACAGELQAAAPPGVPLPEACDACVAAAGAGFEAAAHAPKPGVFAGCVVLSATCSSCGAAAAEVRGTGGVAARGTRLRQAAMPWGTRGLGERRGRLLGSQIAGFPACPPAPVKAPA